MNTVLVSEVVHLESLIRASYSGFDEDDLPQVESADDIINEMVSSCTGKSISLVDLELHGLTDPSYEPYYD